MRPIKGYFQTNPDQHEWKVAQPMQIPFADFLEHTGSENMGARIWRLPPKSASTWHRHIKTEELYFVLEGTGRMRVGEDTLTVPKYGSVLVGPEMMRQVFNDSDEEVVWLMIGAPENELEEGEKFDLRRIWPEDPRQLPKEMEGVEWPKGGNAQTYESIVESWERAHPQAGG